MTKLRYDLRSGPVSAISAPIQPTGGDGPTEAMGGLVSAVPVIPAPHLPHATREELLEALDPGATVSATMILDALARLELDRRTAIIERLTMVMTFLTFVVAIATVVIVIRSLATP
jgi:hypothetical protein